MLVNGLGRSCTKSLPKKRKTKETSGLTFQNTEQRDEITALHIVRARRISDEHRGILKCC